VSCREEPQTQYFLYGWSSRTSSKRKVKS